VGERLPDAVGDRLNENLRNRPTGDMALENVSGSPPTWQEPNLRMRVVALATDLPHVAAFAFGRPRQRFLVRHPRLTDRGGHLELAPQAVDDEIAVQPTHPANDRLASPRVGVDPEGRGFGHQLLQPLAELVQVRRCLRLDREKYDRFRKVH